MSAGFWLRRKKLAAKKRKELQAKQVAETKVNETVEETTEKLKKRGAK